MLFYIVAQILQKVQENCGYVYFLVVFLRDVVLRVGDLVDFLVAVRFLSAVAPVRALVPNFLSNISSACF